MEAFRGCGEDGDVMVVSEVYDTFLVLIGFLVAWYSCHYSSHITNWLDTCFVYAIFLFQRCLRPYFVADFRIPGMDLGFRWMQRLLETQKMSPRLAFEVNHRRCDREDVAFYHPLFHVLCSKLCLGLGANPRDSLFPASCWPRFSTSKPLLLADSGSLHCTTGPLAPSLEGCAGSRSEAYANIPISVFIITSYLVFMFGRDDLIRLWFFWDDSLTIY